jgi:hypothetical protein
MLHAHCAAPPSVRLGAQPRPPVEPYTFGYKHCKSREHGVPQSPAAMAHVAGQLRSLLGAPGPWSVPTPESLPPLELEEQPTAWAPAVRVRNPMTSIRMSAPRYD